jgi:hypothetical protein
MGGMELQQSPLLHILCLSILTERYLCLGLRPTLEGEYQVGLRPAGLEKAVLVNGL